MAVYSTGSLSYKTEPENRNEDLDIQFEVTLNRCGSNVL